MLSQFQASYQRMETALQRLTDSIAAYNPSSTAADELVAADDALNADLQRLVQHQRNHLRIAELQRITEANDQKVRNHIRSLAELRKEIVSIPSSETSTARREYSVDELLAYAKFISPTTIPSTFRKRDLPPKTEPADAVQISNGIPSPPAATQENAGNASTHLQPSVVADKSMNDQDRAWLNPLANLPFEPWPSHDVMLRGSLADIQRMVESGKDPASVLSPQEQAEADVRKREQEERERREEEEKARRRREMFDTAGGRRGTVDDVFDPDA